MSDLKALWRNVAYYTRFTLTMSKIGYLARRLTWGSGAIDFDGKSILITGATAGIGRAAVLKALQSGAKVTAVARNSAKLEALKADAGGDAGRLALYTCDLNSMAETEALCAQLRSDGATFDVIINNVGRLIHEHTLTAEGHETSYALNILNQRLLLENLIAGERLNENASVVNMASAGLYNTPRNVKRLDQKPDRYNGIIAYASHKRAQLAMSDHYQARFADKSWHFYTAHPGWVDTQGLKESMSAFRSALLPILRTPEEGADTALWLGAARPDPVEDRIWFDRKPRAAHAYPHTRTPQASVEEVVDYLDRDIAAFRERDGGAGMTAANA